MITRIAVGLGVVRARGGGVQARSSEHRGSYESVGFGGGGWAHIVHRTRGVVERTHPLSRAEKQLPSMCIPAAARTLVVF